MADIKLSDAQRDHLIDGIKAYMSEELDADVGSFEAGFFLDYLIKEIGPAVYNQAIYDTQAALTQQIERLSEDLLQLEK
ncbi:DUF2164 domain-containing protein [Ponticaulis koreensis]|uniref:DUF2164 domain-containing protein n=1 Tax=Ponticaulis koreensis TaxID=1123045 RepID=UPI0003B2F1E0|nr:DUF2164 domain-containing protein [Ponticaulis koreensis]